MAPDDGPLGRRAGLRHRAGFAAHRHRRPAPDHDPGTPPDEGHGTVPPRPLRRGDHRDHVREAVKSPAAMRLALLAGIAAPIISWALSVVVILGWPGYDPVAQSISLLANAPLGWLQTVAFVAERRARGGVGDRTLAGARRHRRVIAGSSVAAPALRRRSRSPSRSSRRIPGRGPISTIGKIHLANFYLYAVTMPLTLLVLGLVMRRDPRWSRMARPTLVAAALVIVSAALVPLTLDGPLTPGWASSSDSTWRFRRSGRSPRGSWPGGIAESAEAKAA